MFGKIHGGTAATQVLTVAAVTAVTAVAAAQEPPESGAPVTPSASQQIGAWSLSLTGGAEHRFDTDIDQGGEFNVSTFSATLAAATRLTLESDLQIIGTVRWDGYDFNGAAASLVINDPWEDIYTVTLAAKYNFHITNDWSLSIGPILRLSWESGAEIDDALTGGGYVAAIWDVDDDLKLGLGVGGMTQLDALGRFFPIIVIDWEIDRNWRLTTGTGAGADTSLELIYTIDDKSSASFGAEYSQRRFRLDDNAAALNGIGEEETYGVYLKYTLNPGPNASFFVRGGVVADGELTFEDSSGNGVGDEDYDPQYYVGAGLNLKF